LTLLLAVRGAAKRPTIIRNDPYSDYFAKSDPLYPTFLDMVVRRNRNFTLPGCDLRWSDYSSLERPGAAYFYPPVENYLTHKNRVNLLDNVTYKLLDSPYKPEVSKTLTPSASGKFEVGECSFEDDNKDWWTTQVFGPFSSTGGFDWWVFSHADVGHSFAEAQRGRSRLTAYQVQPIDEDGNMIDTEVARGMLHEHHVVFNLETAGVMWTDGDLVGWLLSGRNGDFDRSGLFAVADFHAMNARIPCCYDIREKLNVGGIINDARPSNSPAKTWYYGISLRLSYPGGCEAHIMNGREEPLSRFGIAGMGYGPDAFGDIVQAFVTPNDVETVFYNVFRIPFSGYITAGGWHVHGLNWHKSWLLRGKPGDYGFPMVSSTDSVTMPIPFHTFGTTRLKFEAHIDSTPWICRTLAKEIALSAGLSECKYQTHLEQREPMINVGTFGGFPRDITESGHVNQHMGPHFSMSTDDHVTHNTMCFVGPVLDDFDIVLSRADTGRVLIPPLRSRTISDLAWATVTLFLIALLIWLPCLGRCRLMEPTRVKTVALLSCLFGLCSYWYMQAVMRKFVGNSLDVAALPPPSDPFLCILCAIVPPSLVLILGALCARATPSGPAPGGKNPGYVNTVRHSRAHDSEELIAKV